MKTVYTCLLILSSLSFFSQTKKVKIKLVQYIPYCGGAKPTAEIQKAVAKPVSYSNKKLIVISNTQKVDTVLTDKNGYFVKILSYGNYKVYEPWKYYNQIPKGISADNLNADCLKQEWVKEDLRISVSKKGVFIDNEMKYPKCPYQFPCLINKHLPR